MDSAIVSYETKHPALLPNDHKISRLIMQEVHQCGHPWSCNHSRQDKSKVLDLASSRPGENNQVQVRLLQRNGAKDRDADYGRPTCTPNSTRCPAIPLHVMRLFRSLDSENWEEQNNQALRRYFHLSQHQSSSSGNSHRLFYNGFHANAPQVLFHQRVPRYDAK